MNPSFEYASDSDLIKYSIEIFEHYDGLSQAAKVQFLMAKMNGKQVFSCFD